MTASPNPGVAGTPSKSSNLQGSFFCGAVPGSLVPSQLVHVRTLWKRLTTPAGSARLKWGDGHRNSQERPEPSVGSLGSTDKQPPSDLQSNMGPARDTHLYKTLSSEEANRKPLLPRCVYSQNQQAGHALMDGEAGRELPAALPQNVPKRN